MTDFINVASGDYVPATTGGVVSIAPLPGGNAKTATPMKVFITQLGNFGTGNPVSQLQVQRVEGGTWFDVSGATITDNGSIEAYCYGVAWRFSIPTLTSPGTGATAPRVAYHAQNLAVPQYHATNTPLVSQHAYNSAAGTTSDILPLYGYGNLSKINSQVHGTPFKSLVFLTAEGAGASFVKSTYTDGDAAFEVQEGATISNDTVQVAVVSQAESHVVDFTDSTGTTEIWHDVFQLPV